MAFNISEIKGQLNYGGARNNLFQVQITNPVNALADLKTSFTVKAAQLPESEMGVIEVPYFGRKIKLHGDRTYQPWTVTVINDEDFLVKNALEAWSHAMNSPEGNTTSFGASPMGYKAQAQVVQYGKSGVIVRSYTFHGLFPQAISAIDLNWETNDQIEEFQVQFQYDYWTVNGGITGDGGSNT